MLLTFNGRVLRAHCSRQHMQMPCRCTRAIFPQCSTHQCEHQVARRVVLAPISLRCKLLQHRAQLLQRGALPRLVRHIPSGGRSGSGGGSRLGVGRRPSRCPIGFCHGWATKFWCSTSRGVQQGESLICSRAWTRSGLADRHKRLVKGCDGELTSNGATTRHAAASAPAAVPWRATGQQVY